MHASNIKTIQPYLVFATSPFHQTIYAKDGISHFYTFQTQEEQSIPIVPSGCMDWIFSYSRDNMQNTDDEANSFASHTSHRSKIVPAYNDLYIHGTVLGPSITQDSWTLQKNTQYFGVRFENGYIPNFVHASSKELIGQKIPFDVVVPQAPFLLGLANCNTFTAQMRAFIHIYSTVYQKKDVAYSKHDMINHCKHMIYESNGFVKIEKIAEHLGYTERYLNKIFTDEIGCSAKALCKVVRFQALLVRLHQACALENETKPKMIEVALELGFYDQAQMNKEFKALTHITPKQYLQLLEEKKYSNQIYDVPLMLSA